MSIGPPERQLIYKKAGLSYNIVALEATPLPASLKRSIKTTMVSTAQPPTLQAASALDAPATANAQSPPVTFVFNEGRRAPPMLPGGYLEDSPPTAAELQAQLLSRLAVARRTTGLTQAELSELIGRARMTVHRAEAEGAGVALSTFIEMALALGLSPHLAPSARQAALEGADPPAARPVHRGTHFNRTKPEPRWRDEQRERELARAWEAVNEPSRTGPSPALATLVPEHTPEQACAVATTIQWLGSDAGFAFLSQALAASGYQVVDMHALPSDAAPA